MVGRVIAVHGLKGEVRVAPEDPSADLTGRTVYLGTGVSPIRVLRQRNHPRGRLLVLEGISDRTAAEALVGTEIRADAEDAPALPEGRYYVHELMGLSVYDEDGQELGRITAVEEKPAHDIWVAQGPKGTYMIPAVRATVLAVDRELGRITVRGGGVLGPEPAH